MESNVNNGRLFNDQGITLEGSFYERLFEMFSDDEGDVMFNNDDYECNLKSVPTVLICI